MICYETIWQYGVQGGYHDTSCTCPRHCGNCFEDLDAVREVRDRLIADGRVPESERPGYRPDPDRAGEKRLSSAV